MRGYTLIEDIDGKFINNTLNNENINKLKRNVIV